MTLDHKGAYLNANIEGPPVVMLLDAGVVAVLCKMDSKYNKFVRKDSKIVVRLKKALYGCIQSAVLWYKELSSTIMSSGTSVVGTSVIGDVSTPRVGSRA